MLPLILQSLHTVHHQWDIHSQTHQCCALPAASEAVEGFLLIPEKAAPCQICQHTLAKIHLPGVLCFSVLVIIYQRRLPDPIILQPFKPYSDHKSPRAPPNVA